MKKTIWALLILLPLLWWAHPALGGWIMKSETVRPGMAPLTSTSYYEEGRLATVTPYGTTIIDAQKRIVIQTTPWHKVYAKATVEEMAQKVKEVEKRMKAMLAQMPPEQQAKVKEKLGIGKPKPKVTVKRVGEETILDHPCEIYEIYQGKDKAMKLWIAKDAQAFSPENTRKFEETVKEAFPSIQEDLGGFRLENTPEFKKVTHSGLVLKIIDYRNNSTIRTVDLKKVSVPLDRFSPPPGYKEVSWEELRLQKPSPQPSIR